MAELQTDAANALMGEIVMWMMKYGVDAQEAKAELYILMHDYDISERTCDLVPYEGNNNEMLLKRFIIAKTTAGLSKRTLHYYYRTLRNVLMAIGKDISQITADDVRYYIARRMKSVSKTTLNNERHALSSMFAWLTAEELVQKNIMLKVEALKQAKKKKSALSDDEIEILRANLRTWREKALFEALLYTGCRISEMVSIQIKDIGEDGKIFVLGKGSKWRNVYLNARAKLAIQKYLGERNDTNPYLFPRAVGDAGLRSLNGRSKMCNWYTHSDLVDPNRPMDKSTAESIMRSLGKRSNVENVHPHRMRRTCATMALRKGMTLELVSKMLGHENVATTQIYLDLSEDDLMAAHKRFVT